MRLRLCGGVRVVQRDEHAIRRADGHVLTKGQAAHVVRSAQLQRVPQQIELQRWRIRQAAIEQVPGINIEEFSDLLVRRRRDTEVRGAGVNDATARTVLAHVELNAVDPDGQDLHLPVAVLGHHDRRIGEGLEKPARIVAAHGDLGLLAILALGQEDAKARSRNGPLSEQRHESAEIRAHRQAVEPEAEDAVEPEGLERLCGHLDGKQDAHLNTKLLLRGTLRCLVRCDPARLDEGLHVVTRCRGNRLGRRRGLGERRRRCGAGRVRRHVRRRVRRLLGGLRCGIGSCLGGLESVVCGGRAEADPLAS
mmetsp:Transcript_97606/g.281685  ORF Transcript_97606/g.281685 Transcript_97606/m.281685 type:complete len:308 (-) Transcript_97606:649-1572(-)